MRRMNLDKLLAYLIIVIIKTITRTKLTIKNNERTFMRVIKLILNLTLSAMGQ